MRISDWSSDVCSSDLGDQHDAARDFGNVLEDRRTLQVFQRQYFRWNRKEHRSRAARGVERIDTKARDSRALEREIGYEEYMTCLAMLVVHEVRHQFMKLRVFDRRQVYAIDIDTDDAY